MSARPAASPVFDGPRIFVVLESGIVAAHRVLDGSEAWRVELRTERPVAADDNRVFIASGDAIHALNAETSEVLWRAPVGAITSPLVAHEGWVVAVTEAGVTALRAADGSNVWTRTTSAQRKPATIEGDNLYLPLDDGQLLALDLTTGAERWSKHFTGPLSEVLAFPDRVYFGAGDRNFYCLNAADGEWTYDRGWRFRTGAELKGRPAADDTRVFIASLDNALRAFDRRDGALRWYKGVPFRPSSGPIVVGSAVLVPGTEPELKAFKVANGDAAGQIALAAAPLKPPAFAAVGSDTILTAVIGGLGGELKLVLTEPPLPEIPILPLTALPGTIVAIEPPAQAQP